MDCKNVYPKKTGGMINHLEIFPQELHIFWNADFDKSAVESKAFPDENETQSSNVKTKSIFHAMWLRDNDQGPLSRHPGNGQRLFNIVDILNYFHLKIKLLLVFFGDPLSDEAFCALKRDDFLTMCIPIRGRFRD